MSEISVIVPIYNIKEFLPQCIESILRQTYVDIEIILVDDGSDDGCSDICEEYKQKDSRIIVIHKENGGLVSARKAGLRAASCPYIAYVDGDDWIEPDMYERMHHKLVDQNVDVVMCGRYEHVGKTHKEVYHGIEEGRYGKQKLMETVYPWMISGDAFFEWGLFPGLWDKLFRRECLERFQFMVDERIAMGEDAACVYPCLLNVSSIYVMHECLYHYRQTVASMVKRITNPKEERERFRVLYQSVNRSLESYSGIFDLREQWKRYVLFLMVPRADTLLEGMEQMDYLFPFSGVRKGSKIILYGMGTYGQRLYKYIKRTGFCDLLMAADQNYKELNRQGIPAKDPNEIGQHQYDAIVIANSFDSLRREIYNGLIQNYPAYKVHVMDEALVMSYDIQRRFGLVEQSCL